MEGVLWDKPEPDDSAW